MLTPHQPHAAPCTMLQCALHHAPWAWCYCMASRIGCCHQGALSLMCFMGLDSLMAPPHNNPASWPCLMALPIAWLPASDSHVCPHYMAAIGSSSSRSVVLCKRARLVFGHCEAPLWEYTAFPSLGTVRPPPAAHQSVTFTTDDAVDSGEVK